MQVNFLKYQISEGQKCLEIVHRRTYMLWLWMKQGKKVKTFFLVSFTSKVKNELTNYTVDEHFHWISNIFGRYLVKINAIS